MIITGLILLAVIVFVVWGCIDGWDGGGSAHRHVRVRFLSV